MSNRKTPRRVKSFQRVEKSLQHRFRRAGRSPQHARKIQNRRARRCGWQLITQGLCDTDTASV